MVKIGAELPKLLILIIKLGIRFWTTCSVYIDYAREETRLMETVA